MPIVLTHFEAVLFDLDGTLLDTKADIASCLNQALNANGLPSRSLEEFNQIIGGGIKEAIRRAAPDGTPDEVLDRINIQYQREYPQNCNVKTKLFEGTGEMLLRLRSKGKRFAVITNKTESTSQKIVQYYFPNMPFEFVWGNDGVRPLKPAVVAGRLACATLGLLPEQVGYVGDSGSDMEFANAAGMTSIGACWGYRGYEELKNAGAELLLEHPDAL